MAISRRTLIAATPALAAGLASARGAAAEEAYPNPGRSIRIIVPFSPATGIDILARTLGQKLGEKWKLAVVVDNRVGASGNIGTEAAAKSPPDGYTLLMTANTIVLNRSLFKKIPYDPIKDFAPIAPLAIASMALVTHPSHQGEDRRRADPVREGESGQDQLRLARQRHAAPSGDGAVQARGRDRLDARAVPRHRAGGDRPARRADRRDVPAAPRRAAAAAGRQARHPRRRQPAAHTGHARTSRRSRKRPA